MRTLCAAVFGDKRAENYLTYPSQQLLTDCPRCPRIGIPVSRYSPRSAQCDKCYLDFPLQAPSTAASQQLQLQRVERQELWGGGGQQHMQAPPGGASWTTTCGPLPPNSTFSVTYTLTTDQYGYLLPPAHQSSPSTAAAAAAPPSCWLTWTDDDDTSDDDDNDGGSGGRGASGSGSGDRRCSAALRVVQEERAYQDAKRRLDAWDGKSHYG